MEPFSGLRPEPLWDYFREICWIPRISKKEKQIVEYLLDFARKHRLDYNKDATGNLVIRKPASSGREKLETVILQSHLDMVGEKDMNSDHDFSKDPIIPVRDGDWIKATGTTLGADDGIGIAAQMMILSDTSLEHGAIECLFTVDEESGMTGAKYLEPGFLVGKILVNLDSEDWGELFIGCAGGIDTVGTFLFDLDKVPEGSASFKLSLSGMQGGHSGDEIHKSPANAIKIINRFLLTAGNEFSVDLSDFQGGNMRNAIPREAFAVFTVPRRNIENLKQFYRTYSGAITEELREVETGLILRLEETGTPASIIMQDQQKKFLQAVDACPHGVISWSPSLENLVETSTNLASVKFNSGNEAIITTSQRSSVETAKKEIAEHIRDSLESGGARILHSDGYPGWTPDPDSEILRITSAVYQKLFGKEPVVRAIHAGLECGLILEKYPGLDMVSLGPTIKGAHTPSERIHIGTTEKFWNLLIEILKQIPSEN